MSKTLQLPHLKVSVCPSEQGMLPEYHTLVIVFFVLQNMSFVTSTLHGLFKLCSKWAMRGCCFFFFSAISTFTTSEFLQFSLEDSPVLQNHKLQENDMAVDARKTATSLYRDLVAMPAHNDTQTLLNNPCTHNYNEEQTVPFCHCLTQHELIPLQCPEKPEGNEGWSAEPLKLFICTKLSSVTFHLYTGDAHDNVSLIFLVFPILQKDLPGNIRQI